MLMSHLFIQLLGNWDGRLGPQPGVSDQDPAEPQEVVLAEEGGHQLVQTHEPDPPCP